MGISFWIRWYRAKVRSKSLSLAAFTKLLQISGTMIDSAPMHPPPPLLAMLLRNWSSKPEYTVKGFPSTARHTILVWPGVDTESFSPMMLEFASIRRRIVSGAMECPVRGGKL